MKAYIVSALLAGVLFLSSLCVAGLSAWYVWSVRQIQRIQPQIYSININRTLVQSLVAETLEYSKRNPAITPLLQSVNLLPRQAQSTNVPPVPGTVPTPAPVPAPPLPKPATK